nr:ORF [unidentified cloning vector]
MRPKEKKRGKNWLINSLLVLLFIIGLALIFNNQIRSWVVQQNSRSYRIRARYPALFFWKKI